MSATFPTTRITPSSCEVSCAAGRRARAFQREPEPTELQLHSSVDFDLGYHERRLRFVTSALRWWYRDLADGKPDVPPRADLDRGKTVLYDAVETMRRTMGGDDASTTRSREQSRTCFPDDG